LPTDAPPPPLDLADAALAGHVLGGFEIHSRLGRGAMGTVYRATQRSLARVVALKVLDPALAARPEFAARFRLEARAAVLLDHPHVVQPIDFGEERDVLFFAMELMEGGSAAARLARGARFSEQEALDVGIAMARALAYAQERGVVHRDVKPDNILFSRHGMAKLADLGIAIERARDEAVTEAGISMGTPEYMSPEQARGQRERLDVRSDIYSLGITLFEMLAGERPFKGASALAVMLQHVTAPLPDVRDLAPEVSAQTAAVLARMCAKRPGERWQSAEELRRALEAAAAGLAACPDPRELPGPVRRARVGVHVLDLGGFDPLEGRFEAELYLFAKWRGELDPGRLVPARATVLAREDVAADDAGRSRRAVSRIRAVFHDAFALARFPFDRHVLRIEVEHAALGAEALLLEPAADGFTLAPGLALPGFTLRAMPARAERAALATRLGREGEGAAPEARGRVVFEVEVARRSGAWALGRAVPMAATLAAGVAGVAAGAPVLAGAALVAGAALHAGEERRAAASRAHAFAAIHVSALAAAATGAVLAPGGALALAIPAAVAGATALAAALPRRAPPPARAPARLAPRSARPELAIGLLAAPTRLLSGAVTTAERLVTRFISLPPVEPDHRLNLVPRLVTEVPSFANGRAETLADGRFRLRFRLRRGLCWADGAPVAPEDALAAQALEPAASGARGAVEAGEIVLEYDSFRATPWRDLRLFPRHRLGEFVTEEARARLGTSVVPPLDGPFRLAAWRPEEIVLERNPHHAGGAAALERVRVRVFATKKALMDAFAAGEIGLVPEGVLETQEGLALAARAPGALARVSAAPNWYHLDANLDDAALADRRVREALLLAIDREALVRTVLGGHAKVAHGWLQPQHEGYWDGIPRRAHDPVRAAALLDEAGYRARDGRRRRADGRPLALEVARAERHPAGIVSFLAEAAWGPLGISVVERVHGEEEYFREVLARRRFAHFAFYGYVFDPWESGLDTWSLDRIPDAANGWRGRNWTGFRSERLTALLRRIDETLDPDERAGLYEDAQRLWAEELPALPLYRTEQVFVAARGLRGIVPHAGGEHALPWNAEDWHFAE
jgi:ABC-type transport system substrate-binding protein